MINNSFKVKYRIPTTRLSSWNYSSSGYYFVTICVKDRQCILGKIRNSKMYISDIGQIVKKYWHEIPMHFDNVRLDEFVIMPNHMHGIIVICRDAINRVSTSNGGITKNHNPMLSTALGSIIRLFKGKTTFYIHKQYPIFQWQSRFYEHIIRNETSLHKIRRYIRFNPLKWDIDEENPNLW